MACILMRRTRQASGIEAKPNRRATSGDWSSKIVLYQSLLPEVHDVATHILPSRSISAVQRSSQQDIFGQDVHESTVHGGANVVELCDEGMFEPVDDHLREYDKYHRLSASQPLALTLPGGRTLTDKIASTRLLPLTNDFGKNAMSEPAISIMLRRAMTESIRPSWNLSTMSVSQHES